MAPQQPHRRVGGHHEAVRDREDHGPGARDGPRGPRLLPWRPVRHRRRLEGRKGRGVVARGDPGAPLLLLLRGGGSPLPDAALGTANPPRLRLLGERGAEEGHRGAGGARLGVRELAVAGLSAPKGLVALPVAVREAAAPGGAEGRGAEADAPLSAALALMPAEQKRIGRWQEGGRAIQRVGEDGALLGMERRAHSGGGGVGTERSR